MLYIVLLTTLLSESFYIVHKLYALFHTVYHFSHSMYIHGVNDVRQTETHSAEPLVPETSALDLRWLVKSSKVMSLEQKRF
jgi:hypothetical protein